MEMRLIILLGAFASILVSQASCRAIDNELDNAIQPINDGADFVAHDWIKMVVQPPAKILQEPGEQLELECEVMGSPPPEIEWVTMNGRSQMNLINDIQSNAIPEGSTTSIVRVRSVLILDHPSSKDVTYTCVGRAGGKSVLASTTVFSGTPGKVVIPTPQIRKPKITYSYKMFFDLQGSNIVIPCKASGLPHPQIYWSDVKGNVINAQDSKYKVLPSGELLIPDLKWEDMGHYTCIARNSVGKDSTTTFVYPVSSEDE